MLLGIGALAGYFLADSIINKDFNGSGAGLANPFAKAYGYGFQTSSGITVS